MSNIKRGSAGGQATAIKLRKEALGRYYENPKQCKYCSSVIVVGQNQRIPDVRKKNFCTQKCSGKFFGALNKKPKQKKVKRVRKNILANRTKGEVFASCKTYYSARSTITKHARYYFQKEYKNSTCVVCGYAIHVETAHRKSVMSFPDNALIGEINALENLVALCPNHHWEYDNGVLTLE